MKHELFHVFVSFVSCGFSLLLSSSFSPFSPTGNQPICQSLAGRSLQRIIVHLRCITYFFFRILSIDDWTSNHTDREANYFFLKLLAVLNKREKSQNFRFFICFFIYILITVINIIQAHTINSQITRTGQLNREFEPEISVLFRSLSLSMIFHLHMNERFYLRYLPT